MNKTAKKDDAIVEILPDAVEETAIAKAIEYDITDDILDEAQARIGKMECTNKEERQLLGTEIQTLVASRGGIKDRQKELQGPAKKYLNDVKEEAERLVQRVLDIETPAKEKRDVWDSAEAERIAEKKRMEVARIQEIQDKIQGIKDLTIEAATETTCFIGLLIKRLESSEITDEDYHELVPLAELAKKMTLENLNAMLERKRGEAEILAQAEKERVAAQLAAEEAQKKLEEEQAKLAEQRKEQEATAKKDADKLAKERKALETDRKEADDLAEKKLAEMAEESRRIESEKEKLALQQKEQEAKAKEKAFEDFINNGPSEKVETVNGSKKSDIKINTDSFDQTNKCLDIADKRSSKDQKLEQKEIEGLFARLVALNVAPELYEEWYEAQQ